MGIGYNPKIVTNGLVLCFDAANRKCRAANTEYIFKDLVPGQTFTRLSLGDGVIYNARYNDQGAVVLANQGNNVPNFAAPAYLNFGANAYTVMVWQATQSTNTATTGIISSANTVGAAPYFWGIERSNGNAFFTSRSGTGTLNFPAYTANTFHCYAYTRSGTSMVNYFDGVQANTGTSATDPNDMVANTAYIFFGAPSKTDYVANANIVNQTIGWAGIYNRALSAAEIKQNYDALKTRYLTLNTSYTTESYNVVTGGVYMNVTTVGATVTTDGNFKVATFNDSGSFTVNSLGTDATYGSKVDYLVVAGGGGGGVTSYVSYGGGGGGGGGFASATGQTVSAQAYTITVGGGGNGAPANADGEGTSGTNSSFGSIKTSTGGGGGSFFDGLSVSGNGNGGGGGARAFNAGAGGTGGPDGGYSGGAGSAPGKISASGGGGGGAGGNGFNAPLGDVAGDGGPGASSSITGSSVIYAGGGGGAQGAWAGLGGSGGGGAGRGTFGGAVAGVNGTANRGGGGGGSYESGAGGNGGKGVVIIRWRFQ